jgi:hypothetical protein
MRGLIVLLLILAIAGGSIALLRTGTYGLTIFVVLPVVLGAVASLMFQPETGAQAVKFGAGAVLVGLCSFFAMGLEGAICIAMAAPLALPLGGLGGWLVF